MIRSFCSDHGIFFEMNVLLSEHTTFRIGGAADFFVFPENTKQMADLIRFLHQNKIRYFVLGRGSDILASDDGFRGTVVYTGRMNSLSRKEDRIYAGAGCSMAAVSNLAQREGLAGLEFLHGIPGSVGGGIFMNAGAYGSEIANFVDAVEWVDLDGNIHTSSSSELEFSYRHSYFSENPGIICSAVLRCPAGDPIEIRRLMSDLDSRRREKQPLEFPSAGSAFKRPAGFFAGKLIEDCGLKGYSVGGACISEKHAGFIINKGGATFCDVKELIQFVSDLVFEKTQVRLEPEIRFLDN